MSRALQTALSKLHSVRFVVIALWNYNSLVEFLEEKAWLQRLRDEQLVRIRLACGRSGGFPLNRHFDAIQAPGAKSDLWIGIDLVSIEPNGDYPTCLVFSFVLSDYSVGEMWSEHDLVPQAA